MDLYTEDFKILIKRDLVKIGTQINSFTVLVNRRNLGVSKIKLNCFEGFDPKDGLFQVPLSALTIWKFFPNLLCSFQPAGIAGTGSVASLRSGSSQSFRCAGSIAGFEGDLIEGGYGDLVY